MITELDQQTHDIDWFFTNEDKISFVASGGGKLPRSIAAMTLDSVNCKPLDPLLINQLPLHIQDLIRDIQFEYTDQGSRFSYKAH